MEDWDFWVGEWEYDMDRIESINDEENKLWDKILKIIILFNF